MKLNILGRSFLLLILIIVITTFTSSYNSFASTNTLEDEAWENEDYWEWHTRTTTNDKAYNGTHITMNDNKITFYGYWKNSYKDFLYKNYNNPGTKIFKFTIDESKANYHTLDGAGFIFNSNISDNKISGYILLFTQKNVCLYRIDNVDIEKFETASKSTITTYGELLTSIEKINSEIHNLIVEASPTKILVLEDEKEILSLNLNGDIHVGNNFGLISSYAQHACSILSKIEFSNLEIIIKDFEIHLTNINEKNNNISGGYFQLRDELGNIIKEGFSNENGIFNLNGLNAGSYSIVQTIAPNGYKLNNTPVNFKVSLEGKALNNNNEEIDLIIKNEPITFNCFLDNIDKDKNLLSGGHFELRDSKGTLIQEGYATKNGQFVMIGLKPDSYTVIQTSPPNQYKENKTPINFLINSEGKVLNDNNEEIKLVVVNEKIEENIDNDKNQNKDSDKENVDEKDSSSDNKESNNTQKIDIKNNQNYISNKQEQKNLDKLSNFKDTTITKTALPYTGIKENLLKIIIALFSINVCYLSKILNIKRKSTKK